MFSLLCALSILEALPVVVAHFAQRCCTSIPRSFTCHGLDIPHELTAAQVARLKRAGGTSAAAHLSSCESQCRGCGKARGHSYQTGSVVSVKTLFETRPIDKARRGVNCSVLFHTSSFSLPSSPQKGSLNVSGRVGHKKKTFAWSAGKYACSSTLVLELLSPECEP